MTIRPLLLAACLAAATIAATGTARAQSATDLILNGNFDETTNGEGAYFTGTGTAPLGSTAATDWAACATTACNAADGGYPFIFVATPGIANQTYQNTTSNTLTGGVGYSDPWDDPSGHGNGATGIAFRSVYGTGNGGFGPSGTSTVGAFNGDGPTGHTTDNFLVVDGDYHATVFSQLVGGQTDPTSKLTTPNLIVGDHYQLTFYWAATQWEKYNNTTTEQFAVTFGNSTQTTSIYTLPQHSFSGWMQATMNFTATSANEMLSFLALGTPAGEPPILLLADVAMTDMPEPGAFGLLATGALMLGALARRRRKRTTS